MTLAEVRSALHCYASRRMYLAATVAGGLRFDLDGQPAGEVTARAAEWARGRLAIMDAAAARAASERSKAVPASSQPRREKMHIRPSSGVHRHSLADLRIAAAARRQCLIEERTT
jgi:sRNA-binding protein